MASSARIDELRKKFDENPRRYFAPLANEYRKSGHLDQAIALCRAHLPQQSDHMSGHVVFAQALHEAGATDEAAAVFETALSLDPENLIALRHLGDIARERGDIPGARAWYQRVFDADPRNEEIAAEIAALGVEAGAAAAIEAPAGADAPMTAASQVDAPSTVDAAPEGESAPARASVESLDAAPPAPAPTPAAFVTETMAELYLQQGFRQEALSVYQRLLERDPDNAALRDTLERVERGSAPSDGGAASDAGSTAPDHHEDGGVVASAPAMDDADASAGRTDAGDGVTGRLAHGLTIGALLASIASKRPPRPAVREAAELRQIPGPGGTPAAGDADSRGAAAMPGGGAHVVPPIGLDEPEPAREDVAGVPPGVPAEPPERPAVGGGYPAAGRGEDPAGVGATATGDQPAESYWEAASLGFADAPDAELPAGDSPEVFWWVADDTPDTRRAEQATGDDGGLAGGASTRLAGPGGVAGAGAGSLDALFGPTPVSGGDESAAAMFAGLYTPAGEPPAVPEEDAAGDGARRVPRTPSLDEMFRPAPGEGGAARRAPKFSFDQFFATDTGAGTTPAGAVPHADAGAGQQDEADGEAREIAQFNAWLEGLKKQ